MGKIKPQPLAPGARIGVVAPASPVEKPEAAERAMAELLAAGYQVEAGTTVRWRPGYLAGSDLERRSDLERLWADPAVAAIWCLRGGYGTLRLLPKLYYSLFAKFPKPLIGFSDITGLELALWSQIKLVTFHGPVLTTLGQNTFSAAQALRMLSGTAETAPLPWPPQEERLFVPIRTGRAMGPLLGGNLATLLALLGTRFLPNFDNAVVFVEETGEAPYRIDRMLTQLLLSGVWDNAAAVLVGRSLPPEQGKEAELIAVFAERLAQLDCPAAYGYPIGHAAHQWTLPQGIRAEVDTGCGEVCLLESPFGEHTI
jgi:muramoyltetrapeptide carboxypeptidase